MGNNFDGSNKFVERLLLITAIAFSIVTGLILIFFGFKSILTAQLVYGGDILFTGWIAMLYGTAFIILAIIIIYYPLKGAIDAWKEERRKSKK